MKKTFSILFALALALSVSLVAVPVVEANGVTPDRVTAITRTTDRLVALQGIDGGWDWIVTGFTEHSVNPSGDNLFGVTALGLIDAYQVTGDEAYKTAAELTADHLKGLSRAIDPAVRFQSFDYRFLVEFSALSGDPSYAAHAVSEWDWVKTNVASFYADGNQETIYNFWYTYGGGYGFAAWQAGDCGLATLAMGDTAWASNMAAVLTGHLSDIPGDDIYRFIGWGWALAFLQAADSVTYSGDISALITNLSNSQNVDGSWGSIGGNPEGQSQDIAYVIMGLAAVGQMGLARDGAQWLVANQLPNGGWAASDEYSEVDSEALQALAATAAPVTVDTKGYYSIQAAIDAADPYDTINVAAGTYNENITIDKSLIVLGANAGVNAVTGMRGDESTIDVSGFTGNGILVTADNVIIDGFEIIGIPYGGSPSSNVNPTIAAEANYVTVQNCVFNNDALGKEAMVARPGTNHISFLDNEVNNCMFGITARGSGWGGSATLPGDGVTYLTVSGNTFNVGFVDTDSSITGEAVQIHYGDNIVVTGNTINGPGTFESCVYDLINSIGIADFMSGYGAAGTITYSNNEVTNCYVGIATFAGNGQISGNTVTGNNIGIQVGQNDDVYISTPATGVAITGNDIQNNIRGIWAQNFVLDGLAAHFNNIVGNTEYGVINEDPENDEFDATNNWWGCDGGPGAAGCDTVVGNVLYDPWVTASPIATATGTGTATFVSSGGPISDLTSVPEGSLPAAAQATKPINFPDGLFSFTITGLTNGQTVTVIITLPSGPAPTQYWKYHASEGGWVQIPMTIVGPPNVIRITLVDGGLGDDDGAADGTIVDQGGPGYYLSLPAVYGLMISSTEGGSVTTPGEGVFPYSEGRAVRLVASPDAGHKFVNWTGDVDTVEDVDAAETTITMEDWYSITANFETEEIPPVQYDLTVSSTAGGSVTTPGEGTFTYASGTSVSLVAKPDAGYKFVNWTGSVATIANPNAASTKITMQGNYSITANFEEEEEPEGPPSGPTGCFIATVAYGTPTAEQIDVLREFRDVVLLESTVGSQFVALYYQLSPPVADFIAGSSFLRTLVRELLVDPVVWVVGATGDIWRN